MKVWSRRTFDFRNLPRFKERPQQASFDPGRWPGFGLRKHNPRSPRRPSPPPFQAVGGGAWVLDQHVGELPFLPFLLRQRLAGFLRFEPGRFLLPFASRASFASVG